ncbi:MAG: hypothetical protein ACRDM7_02300 [Thermoleophilaceae bacterium]
MKRALRRSGWRRVRAAKGSHEVWVSIDGRQVTLPGGGQGQPGDPYGNAG